MLDVRRLRVLREVAARGSFSAAAEALDVTQSAVSQHIAALERETATLLVRRNTRGVRLTEAGEVLLRHAQVIVARLADAEAELEAIAGARGGRLRLATFPTAGASIVPRAIMRFRDAHPGVEVILTPAAPSEGEAMLRSGDVDIALLIEADERRSPDDGLDRVPLVADPMYVCLPKGHLKTGKGRLRLDDLRADAWLVGSAGKCPDHAIIHTACNAAGFQPRIAFQSDDYSAMQGFVAAGMGIALVPDLALLSVRDDVVIRAISPRPPLRHVVAGTLAGGHRSRSVLAMLDMLVAIGREFEHDRRTLALAS